MLQSEAGYIDARPHVRQIDETLLQRTAGPYIGVNPDTVQGINRSRACADRRQRSR
jgi:hypothetical protein